MTITALRDSIKASKKAGSSTVDRLTAKSQMIPGPAKYDLRGDTLADKLEAREQRIAEVLAGVTCQTFGVVDVTNGPRPDDSRKALDDEGFVILRGVFPYDGAAQREVDIEMKAEVIDVAETDYAERRRPKKRQKRSRKKQRESRDGFTDEEEDHPHPDPLEAIDPEEQRAEIDRRFAELTSTAASSDKLAKFRVFNRIIDLVKPDKSPSMSGAASAMEDPALEDTRFQVLSSPPTYFCACSS